MALNATIRKVTRGEFDTARLTLLRWRFICFARIVGILVIVKTVAVASMAVAYQVDFSLMLRCIFAGKVALGIAILSLPFLFKRRLEQLNQRQILLRAGILIVLAVITQVTGAEVLGRLITTLLSHFGSDQVVSAVGPLMVILGLIYTAAAFTVPWRFSEAIWPLAIALGILVVAIVIDHDQVWFRPIHSLYLVLACAPGMLVSWLRSSQVHERIALRALAGRYESIYSDLAAARRIHDRLFPKQLDTGPIQFAYRYRPAREIGGDFLTTIGDGAKRLTFVLLDVTGHGVAAALAVNRLHGEIKRVAAENPTASPRDFVLALNHYMFLTLADEYLFATGVVVQFDADDKSIKVCNAGHPAPLLYRGDGKIEKLDANAAMFGILDGEAFVTTERTIPIDSSDHLLLYTDGAVEATNERDELLGIGGLIEQFQQAEGTTTEQLAKDIETRVRRFASSGLVDDTLIAVAKLG